MRLAKVFGLAVVAAVAAMAFVGAGTASAQHSIALCKSLVTLCGVNELWPAGTILKALAKEPKLTNSLGTITCEDSVVEGKSAAAVGNPYIISSPTATFGVLLVPKLGLGCTGPCTAAGQENIHVTVDELRILVEAVDKYFLLGAGLALLLNCPLVGTCVYRSNHFKVEIKHDGTHPYHAGNNLPLVQFNIQLARQTTHGGSAFCPAESQWVASYVLYLAESGGVQGLAWPSLDK